MFSIRKSLKAFVKGQFCFLLMTLVLFLNAPYWHEPLTSWILILMLIQPGIFLLAFVDGFRTKKTVEIEPEERGNVFTFRGFLKSLWFLIPVLLFFTLVTWYADFDGGLPFPSGILAVFLMVNCSLSFLSFIMPSYVLTFYAANAYDKSKTAWSEGFRYIAIYFCGLNGEIQNLLSRFPFYVQRPITLLLCIWYFLVLGGIINMFGL
ncbi:hypothetical protein J32TS2_07790 [Shouchella clausii]|uniref:hypothetical protein n=1 Tax=Shouchella clausii TaxID=79880 RepID=UPI000BA7012D|nr:hypothetical protein [Shouchella clausii]PAE92339.1 hypothetical protein CHH70_15455 [Shouchella clausii]GIN15423.1 hypothetical protein J32TS2_07790 [Shouchella clausii]